MYWKNNVEAFRYYLVLIFLYIIINTIRLNIVCDSFCFLFYDFI